MDINLFESLVIRAIEGLPEEFQDRMENIDVVVEDNPTLTQINRAGLRTPGRLLGLYEGIPTTRRSSSYGMALPDKITLFKEPIEAGCTNDDEIKTAIEKVVLHEIAHHFGISDERLDELGKGKPD